MKDSLVVIGTYWSALQAKMASEVLASEGIAVHLADDAISSVNPFLTPAIGGVRVLVEASDAPRAAELLQVRGLTGEPDSAQGEQDAGALEDEAMEAEPADESVRGFLGKKGGR